MLTTHRGLGDTLQHTLTATGIGPAYLRLRSLVTDRPCGCGERAERLNRLCAYDRPTLTIGVALWAPHYLPALRATLQSMADQILHARLDRLQRLHLHVVCQGGSFDAMQDWLPPAARTSYPVASSLVMPSQQSSRVGYWREVFGRAQGWAMAIEPGTLLRPGSLLDVYRWLIRDADPTTLYTATHSSAGMLCYGPAWQSAESGALADLLQLDGYGGEQQSLQPLREDGLVTSCPHLHATPCPLVRPDRVQAVPLSER